MKVWAERVHSLQAALLVREAPAELADAFVAGRVVEPRSGYGALPPGLDLAAIVERARPAG